ncbi:hypothetical protein Trydic_g16372 [Trypoxylus dichotomus]
MTTWTAPKTTPDIETTTTATATNTKTKLPTPVPRTSKQSAREERRARRCGEAIDAIRLLQDALPLASESTTSDADSDDCSTIGNTSTGESAMDTDDFQLPSARRQLKGKGSRNSSSESYRRKRSRTKPATAGESQPVQSVPNHHKAKDARVPPVVLREKARWMAVNAELFQQGVRTTKVVNTNVGIRIHPASAAEYRQLVRIVSAMKVQYHSYQLTEEQPLKAVIREVSEEEVAQDLANQGFQHASCKRMAVGAARRRVEIGEEGPSEPMPPLQLYGHGQRNCHATPVCVKCAGPHQTAECTKPRDVPAKCALCSGPHTGSYRGCPKSPYNNRKEAPAPTPRPVAPKPAPRPTDTETDAPRPSTSTVKPSYAAAVKKSAPKTVARKPKVSGKPKTSAATTGPKPAPKKSETPKPGKPSKPAVAKYPAQNIPRTTTARTEPYATSTLALLIPLFQRINWAKLQEVATTLLACPRNPQSLQIAFWNANRLTTKKTELEEFVQRHQLDAVLIGETHLRGSNRHSLPNFRVYRADREDARGGGTAILVKSTIEHHTDLALDLINIEATAVTINLATGPVKLLAAYKAPRRQLLEDDLSEIFDTRGAVTLAGDLNAKHPSWNSRRTNASDICLRRFADDLHLLVDATAEPTIFPHNGQPDVLDIMVMKDVAQFYQLTVLNELSSDHNPVLLQLGQAAPEDEEPWTRQTISWRAFADHLSANIGPITAMGGPIELETAVRQVTERVSDSVRYVSNTSCAVDDRAFIPRDVRDLIREKNRLRRQWQGTLNPASKAEYNRMARRTKVALDEFRNNRWGDFMVRASETPSDFWP